MFSRTFLTVRYRISPKSTITVRNIKCHRSLHLASQNRKRDCITLHTDKKNQFRTATFSATFIRHISESNSIKTENATPANTNSPSESTVLSQTDASPVEDVITQIPELPTPLVEEVVQQVLTGEPPFTSLGLGGWTPPGLVQQFLEYLHVTAGLPWWGTIICTTVLVRTVLLPIVIRMQKYSVKMSNIQPQIQYIQAQLADARKMRDNMEVARLTHEFYSFMKEKGVDPLKNAWLPLVQAPIFLSFFWALRGMVHVPVESMKEGGLFWFTDLTVADPYYLLPLLTSVTLAITIEVGTDTMRVQTLGLMRYAFRAAPVVMFPFIMNFEGAILCYWVSTNLFSLIQVTVLRQPKVRKYFNIPELIKHDIKKLPASKKKFVDGFKDSWTNMQVARELKSREMYDEVVFEKAGKGPVPKTYKFDPTKPRPANAILSKKRD